jgi:hypothetical protein
MTVHFRLAPVADGLHSDFMLPAKLYFQITGFFRRTHEVEWRDGRLWYRPFDPPGHCQNEVPINPSPEAWQRFWQSAEQAGVWQWQKEYDSEICDGVQWTLELEHGSQAMNCSGSNAFPGTDDSDYTKSAQFNQLIKALRRLTGQKSIR